MRDWTSKNDDSSNLTAEEFNDLSLELEHTCLSTGETLFSGGQRDRDTNTNQLQATIMKLASSAYFLQDSGTVNVVKLLSPNNYKFESSLIDNQVFKFIAGNTNTSTTTISAYNSAVVPLKNLSNQELTAKELVKGTLYEVKTNFSNGALVSFTLLAKKVSEKQGIGEFNATHTYALNEMCIVEGLLYKSLVANNTGFYPPSQPSKWELYRNIYVWNQAISSHYSTGDLFIDGDVIKALKVNGTGTVNPHNDAGTNYHTLMLETALGDYYTKEEANATFYSRDYIDSLFMKTDTGVQTFHIKDGSITTPKLSINAVTSVKIKDGEVTHPKIALSAVEDSNIAQRTITADKIVAGTITATEIASNTITATELADNSIGSSELQSSSIVYGKIAPNAIQGANIRDGSVTASKLVANSITSREIKDGSLSASKLTANSVGARELQNYSITNAKLAVNAVATGNIQNRSVTAEKLATNAISNIGPTQINGLIFPQNATWHAPVALSTSARTVGVSSYLSFAIFYIEANATTNTTANVHIYVGYQSIFYGKLRPTSNSGRVSITISCIIPPGGTARYDSTAYTGISANYHAFN